MSRTWISSDFHYGHGNLVRGISSWEDTSGCRDFKSIDQMNSQLVNNLNEVIATDDTLYCLGDWSFGKFENIEEFRSRINCKNIHLILGNHDKHIANNKGNCQSLFSSVSTLKEINYGKQKLVLCHYSMNVWNKSHHGAIHLFGHSHGSLTDVKGKSMDVGVDTNDLFPYEIEEILSIMKDKPINLIDHHDRNTN